MQAAYQRNTYSTSTRATENRGAQPMIRVALEVERIQIANSVHDPARPARIEREIMIIRAGVESGLFTIERGENTNILNGWIKLRDVQGVMVALIRPRVCRDGNVVFSAEVDGTYEKAGTVSREGVEGWCIAEGQDRREKAALKAKAEQMKVQYRMQAEGVN